jgi:predicted dithiol-disulfide oxidoreductase (DUF899 family)
LGRRPLVVRVTYRRTDGRKARRNEPVLRIPALPGPADQDPAEILADDARLGRQAAAVFRGSRALAAKLGPDWQGWTGEIHGLSAFLHRGDRVFHTYSSYARGTDMPNSTYQWLDLTSRVRQEDWEQPPGRSDGPLMSWLRHHDRYGA